MKELSIEEKAKHYDKAIERAKAYQGLRSEMEIIFPELKESEDEKIRKAIGELIHDTTGDSLWIDYGVHKEEALAWLEKQGEQKPDDKVEPKFKVKYAGSEYNVFETKNIAGVTYYGIEDEPNHIDYVQAENCERVDGYSIKESGSPFPTKPAKFSEQNSTWSEEDEKILNYLLWFYDTRFRWNDTCGDDIKFGDIVNFLKSLKERYSWKPSDEQMVVLNDIIINGHLSNANERILKSLQEQLKKL